MARKLIWRRSMADYTAVLFGSGAARIVALVNSVLIARFLGSEKFGQFSLFYVVMLFAWIVPKSIDTAFIKFAKSHETAEHMIQYWRVNVQIKISYCVIMVLAAWPGGSLMANVILDKPHTAWLISLGILCGAFLSIMDSVASSFQIQGQFGRFALVQGLYTVVVCIGLFFLFLTTMTRSVTAVISIYLVVSITMGIFSSIILLRATPNLLKIEPGILKQVIGFGKWIFFSAISLYTFPRIDCIVLARYLNLEMLGIYSVASQLTIAITVVTNSMGAVFLPRAMQAFRNANALQQYLKDATRPIIIVLTGILLLEITAPFLIERIYGQAYGLAAKPMRILLIGYVFSTIYLPLSFLFYTLDRPQIRFILETGKMLLVLMLFTWFIPLYGLAGAAGSMATAMTANCLISLSLLFYVHHQYQQRHLCPKS